MIPFFGAQKYSRSAKNTALGGMVQGEVRPVVVSQTALDAKRLCAPPQKSKQVRF